MRVTRLDSIEYEAILEVYLPLMPHPHTLHLTLRTPRHLPLHLVSLRLFLTLLTTCLVRSQCRVSDEHCHSDGDPDV